MVSSCCGINWSRHQSYGTHRGSNVILDRWTSLTYARKSMFCRVACGPFFFASKAIANWQCYVEPATYRWFSPDVVTFPRVWVTKTLEPPLASSPYFIFFTRNNMRLHNNAVCGLGISELCSSANNRYSMLRIVFTRSSLYDWLVQLLSLWLTGVHLLGVQVFLRCNCLKTSFSIHKILN